MDIDTRFVHEYMRAGLDTYHYFLRNANICYLVDLVLPNFRLSFLSCKSTFGFRYRITSRRHHLQLGLVLGGTDIGFLLPTDTASFVSASALEFGSQASIGRRV
jgi:hypothetical protein